MTLYCVNNAYTGIKDVAISAPVQWTEGFDVGCAHSSLLCAGLCGPAG